MVPIPVNAIGSEGKIPLNSNISAEKTLPGWNVPLVVNGILRLVLEQKSVLANKPVERVGQMAIVRTALLIDVSETPGCDEVESSRFGNFPAAMSGGIVTMMGDCRGKVPSRIPNSFGILKIGDTVWPAGKIPVVKKSIRILPPGHTVAVGVAVGVPTAPRLVLTDVRVMVGVAQAKAASIATKLLRITGLVETIWIRRWLG